MVEVLAMEYILISHNFQLPDMFMIIVDSFND